MILTRVFLLDLRAQQLLSKCKTFIKDFPTAYFGNYILEKYPNNQN